MAALTHAAIEGHAEVVRLPGGSAANVLKGLAGISGGTLRCEMVGVVGADEAGAFYTTELTAHGVTPRLLVRLSLGGKGACARWWSLINLPVHPAAVTLLQPLHRSAV